MIKYFILLFLIFYYLTIYSNYDLSSIIYILYISILFIITFPISLIILLLYNSLYLFINDL
jgi:hypothetical protein